MQNRKIPWQIHLDETIHVPYLGYVDEDVTLAVEFGEVDFVGRGSYHCDQPCTVEIHGLDAAIVAVHLARWVREQDALWLTVAEAAEQAGISQARLGVILREGARAQRPIRAWRHGTGGAWHVYIWDCMARAAFPPSPGRPANKTVENLAQPDGSC